MRKAIVVAAGGMLVIGAGCEWGGKPGRVQRGPDPILEGFDDANPRFDASTHFAAGQLAETQRQPTRAIEQYQAALKLDPSHRQAMYRLAMVYTDQRQLDSAIEAWKGYVAATGYSASAWSNLAYCYEIAGKYTEAEAAYRSGIEKDPKNEPCRVNYGLMLARQRRFVEARQQWIQVLDPPAVEYNLGSVYEQLREGELARSAYETALRIDPNFSDARKRLEKLGLGPTAILPRE
ncbi:MAG TPA: tetratricopeptide repeat protein [Tepidisphaeraceae bacterium]|nr:tetratricopeptide repeat protein [Tepidisphaeraceae bacterium]